MDVAPVVALHRWQHVAALAERPEQLGQARPPAGDVLDRRRVHGAHQPLRPFVLRAHLRVERLIQVAGAHALPVRARVVTAGHLPLLPRHETGTPM